MKVLIKCLSCVFIKKGQFESEFWTGPKDTNLKVFTDTPLIPGEVYEILLKGIYPGSACGNQACVGGVMGMGVLKGMSLEEEMKFREIEV